MVDLVPRSKPHFKVHTTIKAHRKMAAVYADNRLLVLWLRLGIEAVERWADRTGDTFLIPDRELMALTGLGRQDVARTCLERLADVGPISAERFGEVWRITWPNFQRKQGFFEKNGKESGTSPSPPPSPPPIKKKKASTGKPGSAIARFWTEKYEETRGVKYRFTGKDGKLLHDILNSHGQTEIGKADIGHCILAYLKDESDEWSAKNGWTVGIFSQRFQALLLKQVKERENKAAIIKRQETAGLDRAARQLEPLMRIVSTPDGA